MYGENGNRPILSSAEIKFLLSDHAYLEIPKKHHQPDAEDKTVGMKEKEGTFFCIYTKPTPPKASNA